MSILPSILCPHCGTQIEIAAKAVQAELPLGPIEVRDPEMMRAAAAIKLDMDSEESVKIQRPTDRGFDSLLRLSTESDLTADRPAEPESTVASCEEDLIRSIQKIIGQRDWILNEKTYRSYLAESRRAIAYGIEDWKVRTPDQRRKIRNKGAWLIDRFKRALNSIGETKEEKQKRA